MFFITKPVTTDSFIFKEKYQKETLCLTHFMPDLCCPHIETSQLICTANQLTGFYMRATLDWHVKG